MRTGGKLTVFPVKVPHNTFCYHVRMRSILMRGHVRCRGRGRSRGRRLGRGGAKIGQLDKTRRIGANSLSREKEVSGETSESGRSRLV